MKKWIPRSAVSIVIFLIMMVFQQMSFFQSVENLSSDLRMRWSDKQQADPGIAIIGIDAKSLNQLGQWPWNREIHTKFIEALAKAQPRVTVFDILFSEPSSNGATDEELAQALKKLRFPILAEYGEFSPAVKNRQLQVQTLVQPIPALQSFLTGHINVMPDNDGVVRTGLYRFSYQGQPISSIDQVAAESYSGFPIKEEKFPMDFLNRWTIPYELGMNYPVYSYIDILNGDVPVKNLKDKLLIIGPTSKGLFDHYPTPIGNEVNGVVIHAYMIDALLHDRSIRPIGLEWAFILAFVIIGQWVARACSMRLGVPLTLFLAVLYAFLSLFIMNYYHLYITIVAPIVVLLLSYAGHIGYNFFNERKERQQVIRLFGRFVAPQVVGEIIRLGEDNIKLGGVKQYISVLFLDIRGFTPLSEKLSPEEVVDVLNSFFSDITAAIFKHGGTLDKFIGDAVMAIYNAPLSVENHELQAVKTAIDIQRSALQVQKEIEKKYGRTVAFGIGIHCGEAVVGNIGAMQRLDYTAIGDTVNLAARLESNAKPNQIIVSQQIYDRLSSMNIDEVNMNSLGTIQVKGKSEPVHVYEVNY
ncbi:MAG TPA: adenylate/guanylate cyclase domain-containing protein [Bacillota bacterium]|nr:adenylate/guanylate cyclase domain-containing protein [Bacillota bacterium]